jgi:hypothetical protein
MAQAWATTTPANPRFDIALKLAWDATTNTSAEQPVRAADCFVFCLNTSLEADATSVLDPDRWGFFVVATRDLDRLFPAQRTLGLASLRRLVEPVPLSSLRSAVDDALAGPACPVCGAPDARPILYGQPAGPPPEDVVLGGCVISPDGDDPTHECRGPERHRFIATR